jgi:ribonuclease-3
MSEFGALEVRLDYCFTDRELLVQALTHRSHHHNHNERLEFLGDSVLGFVVADSLYHQFPRSPEGDLTRMRARLVRRDTLASVARDLSLGNFLQLGEGEYKSGGFDRNSILADALEAVFGAVYLDGGYRNAKTVILKLFAHRLATITVKNIKDNKTLLQELLQKKEKPLPVYQVVEQRGEAHALEFRVKCEIDHTGSPFFAKGNTRRGAEQTAAGIAIVALESGEG